jgi:hypothetical protein
MSKNTVSIDAVSVGLRLDEPLHIGVEKDDLKLYEIHSDPRRLTPISLMRITDRFADLANLDERQRQAAHDYAGAVYIGVVPINRGRPPGDILNEKGPLQGLVASEMGIETAEMTVANALDTYIHENAPIARVSIDFSKIRLPSLAVPKDEINIGNELDFLMSNNTESLVNFANAKNDIGDHLRCALSEAAAILHEKICRVVETLRQNVQRVAEKLVSGKRQTVSSASVQPPVPHPLIVIAPLSSAEKDSASGQLRREAFVRKITAAGAAIKEDVKSNWPSMAFNALVSAGAVGMIKAAAGASLVHVVSPDMVPLIVAGVGAAATTGVSFGLQAFHAHRQGIAAPEITAGGALKKFALTLTSGFIAAQAMSAVLDGYAVDYFSQSCCASEPSARTTSARSFS